MKKLIHLSNAIHVTSELVKHSIRVKNLRLFTKSQNPAEELVADFHLCGYAEVGFVHLGVLNILCSETVNNSIQKRIDETDFYQFLLATVHGEYSFGVGFQVNLLELFIAISWFPCEANVLHTVNTIGSHFLGVIIESQKVVVAVVDEQLEGADYVPGSVAAFHLFAHVADRILQVLEGDLLRCVGFAVQVAAHSVVDGGDVVHHASIVRLYSVRQKCVMPKTARTVLWEDGG